MKRRQKRTSIQTQLLRKIILLVVMVMAVLACLNIFALKPFYYWQKVNELQQSSERIQEQVNLSEFITYADEYLRERNVSVNVYTQAGTLLFSSNTESIVDGSQLGLNQTSKPNSKTKKLSDLFSSQDIEKLMTQPFISDTQNDDQVLAVAATYQESYILVLQTPLVAISASIDLFNQFLLIGLVLALVIGWIWSVIVARQYSRPIIELQHFAQNLTEQNYQQQWHSQRQDEFGDLGTNMNELAMRLDEVISQLETKNQLLADELAKKEQFEQLQRDFISDVSHELKTPIALIQGYSEGLSEGIVDDETSRQEYYAVIMDEAKIMQQLVEELLQLAKLDSPLTQLQVEAFALDALVLQVGERYEQLGASQHFQIVYDLEAIEVIADQKRIEQVVSNYLTNAIRHVKMNGEIRVGLSQLDDEVRVSVFNQGDPIPSEALTHVWQRFYKIDQSRVRGNGGSGLGLAIVASIITSHGGRFGVNNHSDGVEFWMSLPLEVE